MKKAFFLIGLFLLLFLMAGISQSTNNWKVQFDQYNNHGELYFRFNADGQDDLNKVARILSIDKPGKGDWFYAYANEKQFKEFSESGLTYETLKHPSTLIQPRMLDLYNQKQLLDWDFYPTYDVYVEMMYQFETDYPGLCTVVNIGQSEEGRDLLFVVISDNVGEEEGEAQFMYTATMHGNETAGYVLTLRLIDYLLSNYASNADVYSMVNNLEIWINPLANPDGTYASGNHTVSGATRSNANLVNLNRNYPDPDDGPHPDGNAYQAETLAFMALAENQHFVMSANFHGGAEVFNYPWDTFIQLHADDDWWVYTGRQWADTVHLHSPVGYFNDLDNGITNGYAWYPIEGGRQDYMNYFMHCREVTLELSAVKLLPASQLPDFWEYSYRSFLNYMNEAMYGIKGQVTDSINGGGIMASIYVEDHDIDNSWVASYGDEGWYHRPINEGTYDLTFFAPGYTPKTIGGIDVQLGSETQINVQLVPTESGTNDYLSKHLFKVGPNPVDNKITIHYLGMDDNNFQIEVISSSGKRLMNRLVYGQRLQEGYSFILPNSVSGLFYLKISQNGKHQLWKLIHLNQE